MSEHPKTPSAQEMLQRIIALEQENAGLRKQLGEINGQLTDLGAAFKFEVTNVTAEFERDRSELKHIYKCITDIHQYLADIHEQLWPLVRKVFPGSAATQQQIAAIRTNGGRSWDDKRPR